MGLREAIRFICDIHTAASESPHCFKIGFGGPPDFVKVNGIGRPGGCSGSMRLGTRRTQHTLLPRRLSCFNARSKSRPLARPSGSGSQRAGGLSTSASISLLCGNLGKKRAVADQLEYITAMPVNCRHGCIGVVVQ
jgi:hypothetical protein